ncbi:MAG: sulfatase, partial [Candidatus Aminicenantaceae bacterium]
MFKQKTLMFFTLVIMFIVFGCSGPDSDQPLLTAELPLHLEEHINDARIEDSAVGEDFGIPIEWHFDEPQPDWKPTISLEPSFKPARMTYVDNAMRITLSKDNLIPRLQTLYGGIFTDLPKWHWEDWHSILVSARTKDDFQALHLVFNFQAYLDPQPHWRLLFSDYCELVEDGSVHTYMLKVRRASEQQWKSDPLLEKLCINVVAEEPASVDILSVKAIPRDSLYSHAPVGLSTDVRGDVFHHTLFMHTPGKLGYQIKVPKAGRLDVGLGLIHENNPVTFRIKAIPRGGEEETLLEEVYTDSERWAQRSVDLSSMAGQKITLRLESEAERPGNVSLWAAPTLSGKSAAEKPNVILYIIDGASADYMSVYGYNRRTTPNLERLAAEGAVFEHAYSNATWTKVSNPSFMTSLYSSALGGYTSETGQLPDQAITMAQFMNSSGYQTGVLTTNPYCGTMSGFDRGVDWLREKGMEDNSTSSIELHKDFWEWRAAYPGEPYWVHFQTTDVHWPFKPAAPFSGLFLSPELRLRYYEWERQVTKAAGVGRAWPTPRFLTPDAFKKAGINHLEYFEAVRCLYDEAMAHNDYQIGKLAERLKSTGEWKNTLLIIAADHGSAHGLGFYDPFPPAWGPLFRSIRTRIPMIVIWPEHIASGLRLRQPVSMIDMLPTVLDLAGLPVPAGLQGQSLAPLLLGEEGWHPRPVVFDEFYLHQETGKLAGKIEVIDGRWGASLDIDPSFGEEKPFDYSPGPSPPFPVLIYDIWEDPNCLVPLNDTRPDLVK